MKSRLGKRKYADVAPKYAGDSRRSGGKIYKTDDYVARGEQYTQRRKKIKGNTQGADGRKPDAPEYSRGRKLNGRRDRKNCSTNIRVATRCGEEEYGMVSAYGGYGNFWASSDNTRVLGKFSKIIGRCRGGGSKKCAMFKIQAENLRVFLGMVKGDAELKIFHSMLK